MKFWSDQSESHSFNVFVHLPMCLFVRLVPVIYGPRGTTEITSVATAVEATLRGRWRVFLYLQQVKEGNFGGRRY